MGARDPEREAAVVAAARALIARDGLAKFSLRALSAETGIARSTLHRRFGGKQALLATILADDVAALSGMVAAAAPQVEVRQVVNGPAVAANTVPPADAWLERRLRVFERALGTLETRQENFERNLAALVQLDETLQAFSGRIAAVEARSDEAAMEAVAARATLAFRPAERPRLAPLADARVEEPELPFVAPAPQEPATPPPPRDSIITEARRHAAEAAAAAALLPLEEHRETRPARWRIAAVAAMLFVLVAGVAVACLAHSAPHAAVSGRRTAATASERLVALADSGAAVAQYELGTRYLESDPRAALRWLGAAAAQGNRKAMHNLAVAYALGRGTPADPMIAAHWFARAASLGYVDSAFDLAVLYERGQGVPQSLGDACKWYLVAAREGDAQSAIRAAALATQMRPADFVAARAAAGAFTPAPYDRAANGISRS